MAELAFIRNIFEAQGLQRGHNPVRRKIETVLKLATEEKLVRACRKRGLILMKTPKQYVIYPTRGFKILTGG